MATVYKLTKTTAVNIILSNIGQAPLTDLDTSNPLAQLASGMIDEVSHSLQSEGWVFNTEQDVKFYPDPTTKHIEIPTNVLSIRSKVLVSLFTARFKSVSFTLNSIKRV